VTGRAASRWTIIALAAALVNLAMFTTIQLMVGNRRIRLADTSQFDVANFIRAAEPPRDVRRRRDPKAPRKPAAEQQRDIQRLAQSASSSSLGAFQVDLPRIDVDVGVDLGKGLSLARELTPLVRFPPQYPQAALLRKTEGSVLVRFTVTETGGVSDPEILRSDPPGVFDRAAIRAILRWKYQPQLVNGKPASVISYTRIKFLIPKK